MVEPRSVHVSAGEVLTLPGRCDGDAAGAVRRLSATVGGSVQRGRAQTDGDAWPTDRVSVCPRPMADRDVSNGVRGRSRLRRNAISGASLQSGCPGASRASGHRLCDAHAAYRRSKPRERTSGHTRRNTGSQKRPRPRCAGPEPTGRRVVAVGTTVVRALESAGEVGSGRVVASHAWTELVVTPERGVQVVDNLMTGFHEPKATHLAMLEAIAGRSHLEKTYAAALRRTVPVARVWRPAPDLVRLACGGDRRTAARCNREQVSRPQFAVVRQLDAA